MALLAFAGDPLSGPLPIVLLVIALIVTWVVRTVQRSKRQRRRPHPHRPAPSRRPGGRPETFEYWYAMVPFEDQPGGKDRPVLVLRRGPTHVSALKVTSQDKSARRNYRRIDTSTWQGPGQRNGSWLQVDRAISIPVGDFRRRLGSEADQELKREVRRSHPTEFH